jgi:hypothetical protein
VPVELNQVGGSEIPFIECYGRIRGMQRRYGYLFLIRDLLAHCSIDLRLTAFTDLFHCPTISQGEERE